MKLFSCSELTVFLHVFLFFCWAWAEVRFAWAVDCLPVWLFPCTYIKIIIKHFVGHVGQRKIFCKTWNRFYFFVATHSLHFNGGIIFHTALHTKRIEGQRAQTENINTRGHTHTRFIHIENHSYSSCCVSVCAPTVQGCGVRLRKLRFSTHTYTQTQTQLPRGFSLFLRTTIILISSAKSNTVFPLEVRKFRKILVGGLADVRKREALRERYFAPIPLNGDRLPYKKSRCAQRTPQRNCTTRPFAKD